ncbi:restriction endonuclease subunit S [Prevotella denticola]|uniref:restriction endonuclease subunit S n=1 Tax=Prevotella denticola TaxID=28129 RepID=UPI001C5E9CA1|nr:restriction endonuclease subunit S [Prevotella denticola]MBW4898478.1 restriction endonuclease subunit S [Prevotella denticola]
MHHYEQDVPNGWCISTIGNVFTLQAGKNITANHISSSKNNKTAYPCFGGNGLRGYVNDFNRQGNYPIIGRQGALCGNINLAQGNFYATEHAVTVERYCNVDLMWVFYALIYLNLNQYATATAQPGLSVNVINEIPIAVPPLNEQLRISKQITTWFSIIDAIEQSKEDLQTAIKQAKSKILDLAIHGKLVSQDPNDEPASELLKRINPKAQITCDNEHYAQLPKGWSVISMQDVCKLKDGIKLDSTPLINLDVKYLRGTSAGKVIDSGKFVTANSYMILVDGENSGEVFKTSIDGYQGSTFKLLDIDQNVNEEYILNVINLHRKALRENKVGSAIPHLNKKLFKAISVPLPPYNEQIKIVEAIKSIFNLLDAVKENL